MIQVSEQQIVHDIWYEKYRYGTEQDLGDTLRRISKGICEIDQTFEAELTYHLLEREIIPAGRIHAGAGTNKRVTLINCFVGPTIEDSMLADKTKTGIMEALSVSAVTQQMSGGIGNDFSTIRPNGAEVKRGGSVSSGVLPFMDMWHAMCSTVRASGSRRGAMMGTLACTHPDLPAFIIAKQKEKRLSNFNVSVLVTHDFMAAVNADAEWDLYFPVPMAEPKEPQKKIKIDGQTQYVYATYRAKELWDLILENTYVYAEPGVLFIDTINEWNNLWYCERIHATNPCGEQPLPANGACNLSHTFLVPMVDDAWTPKATFNFDKLRKATAVIVRMLDNVLDVSDYPTEEMREEARLKRRTGIGYTGLANALAMLGLRYGSPAAVKMTNEITREMTLAAYRESVNLARTRGPFPLFDAEKFLAGKFVSKLPDDIKEGIRKHGIRNGVLMTVAPVGTGSLIAYNSSSAIEPTFGWQYTRKVLQEDGSLKEYEVYDLAYLLYHQHMKVPLGSVELPSYMVTANQLTISEHLNMQAAAQEWIDSAISKTINVPTETDYETFKGVYAEAYKLGLKGCTTYRHDEKSGRGSILSTEKKAAQEIYPIIPMQDVLEGRRYRIKWPVQEAAIYLQVNDYIDEKGVRRPFEIFLNSKSPLHDEWMTAVALLVTATFRRGGDITFIVHELKQVVSATGGAWMGKAYVQSLVAAIGQKIEEHFEWLGLIEKQEPKQEQAQITAEVKGAICPKCSAPTYVREEGCSKCKSCGYSNCG